MGRRQGRGPLRILHVDTERGWRGGERQALWLAEGLRALGDECALAARDREPFAERGAAAGFPTLPLAPAFGADPRAVKALRRGVRSIGADLVHAHSAHALTLAALATLGTGIPLVASRRVDFPIGRTRASRWKYERAAVLIAVSRAVARVVARAGLAVPVHVVHDGTDLRRDPPRPPREVRAALGIAAGAPLAVQVAQLVEHKDPLTFVEAVRRARRSVPTLRAVLVGDGPLRRAVEGRVHELGLARVLSVAGYRDDADAILAAADLVVLSSREEGLGSVLLDALVFGRPVAATRAGGIPEVVRDGETGLLSTVGDADALGQAIARLATDAELRARLGAGARARAPEFSLEKMARATRAIYEEVLVANARR